MIPKITKKELLKGMPARYDASTYPIRNMFCVTINFKKPQYIVNVNVFGVKDTNHIFDNYKEAKAFYLSRINRVP